MQLLSRAVGDAAAITGIRATSTIHVGIAVINMIGDSSGAVINVIGNGLGAVISAIGAGFGMVVGAIRNGLGMVLRGEVSEEDSGSAFSPLLSP